MAIMREKSGQILLKPNERLAGISKEYHVRKQGGKYLAYVVLDKYAQYVLLGQKLSSIVDVINNIVDEEPDKVSIAGLYHKIHRKEDKTGGYLRHRWRIQPYTLEEATEAFNRARDVYSSAAVIGTKECYNTVCV